MTDETKPETASANSLEAAIIKALHTVYDPEIPVDIYELGLIYGIEIDAANDVVVKMTLTTPNCPVAETLPLDVEQRVGAVEGVATARVELTWEPPWSPEMMSEAAKLELNL